MVLDRSPLPTRHLRRVLHILPQGTAHEAVIDGNDNVSLLVQIFSTQHAAINAQKSHLGQTGLFLEENKTE